MKSPQKALQKNCLCRKAPNITKENELVEMGRLQAKALWVDEKFPIAQISAIWDKLGWLKFMMASVPPEQLRERF